jgi:rifampin ADP-ribosylating transferase
MEFSPNNPIVKLCIQGMISEEKGNAEEAGKLFLQAWTDASNDFEKFLAANAIAKHKKNTEEKLQWFKTSLQFALTINDVTVASAFGSLYENIAKCYEELGNLWEAEKNYALAHSLAGTPADSGPFYHGTKADLLIGDMLTPGGISNYNSDVIMNHIYFTAIINGAGLAAHLAKGEGRERVYVIEPTGDFENDPNVTDKKFPGNMTRSYRSLAPLKIIGEIPDWTKQTPEDLKKWRERLANVKGEIIN